MQVSPTFRIVDELMTLRRIFWIMISSAKGFVYANLLVFPMIFVIFFFRRKDQGDIDDDDDDDLYIIVDDQFGYL